MIENSRFHHFGIVTDNIIKTVAEYRKFGYTDSAVVKDEIQDVRICFLSKLNSPMIEVVEPASEDSSLQKLINRQGVGPYHVCYEVESIDKIYELLIHEGWTPLFRPVEAKAFNGRHICYFFKKCFGFLEVINSR